jgi:hypothetical protein
VRLVVFGDIRALDAVTSAVADGIAVISAISGGLNRSDRP